MGLRFRGSGGFVLDLLAVPFEDGGLPVMFGNAASHKVHVVFACSFAN